MLAQNEEDIEPGSESEYDLIIIPISMVFIMFTSDSSFLSSCDEQHSDPFITYVSYLKERYTFMSHSHTSQHWSHLPRCEFIQLTMIGAQEVRRGGPEEEMIRLAQQGKIETILGHKGIINLNDIFLSAFIKNSDICPPTPPSPSSPLLPYYHYYHYCPLDCSNLLPLLRPNPRLTKCFLAREI